MELLELAHAASADCCCPANMAGFLEYSECRRCDEGTPAACGPPAAATAAAFFSFSSM